MFVNYNTDISQFWEWSERGLRPIDADERGLQARRERHHLRADALKNMTRPPSRRRFLQHATLGATALALDARSARAQIAGERPARADGISVLNPRGRVPVGLIIDDSTCLVNLNRFAMPQFDTAFAGANKAYLRDWREWPVEIPDAFVRKFGEWCAEHGVKGKYSIVPYPACVGRLDRELPGWTDAGTGDEHRPRPRR